MDSQDLARELQDMNATPEQVNDILTHVPDRQRAEVLQLMGQQVQPIQAMSMAAPLVQPRPVGVAAISRVVKPVTVRPVDYAPTRSVRVVSGTGRPKRKKPVTNTLVDQIIFGR